MCVGVRLGVCVREREIESVCASRRERDERKRKHCDDTRSVRNVLLLSAKIIKTFFD